MAKRVINAIVSKTGTEDKEQKVVSSKPSDVLWRLESGSLYLADGRRIEAGERGTTFYAPENAISKAFMNTVKRVVASNDETPIPPPIRFEKVEIEATDEEKESEDFVQMYNVVNLSGTAINPAPLDEAGADYLLGQLNG